MEEPVKELQEGYEKSLIAWPECWDLYVADEHLIDVYPDIVMRGNGLPRWVLMATWNSWTLGNRRLTKTS